MCDEHDDHDVYYGLSTDLCSAHGWDDEGHPRPQEDGIAFRNYGYGAGDGRLCGFASPADAKTWFKDWQRKLNAEGFQLTEYEVPADAVEEGSQQLVFDRSQATTIGRRSLLGYRDR